MENNYDAELAIFKKKLKQIGTYRGKHTELISLYVPFGTDRSTVMNQLNEEINQSSNIKSPTNRKNVQGALRKIIVFLKNIDFRLPPTGIVIFSGNISEVEGRSDIKLFTIHPPKNLNTKLYWCDSTFHLDPLKEMIVPNEFYALMTIDKNESTIALLSGRKYEILGHFTSMVPGKTRAGGQCLTPDTQIILSNGEIINIENVKENELIKSIDFKSGQTIDSRITKKWQTVKDTLTIQTQNPKFEISCSPDHLFFICDNGTIITKPASELNITDTLLFNETIKIDSKEIELINNVYNRYSLTQLGQATIMENRSLQGLTQKQLAKQIDISQTEISHIELGKRNFQRKTINSVCKGLQINPEKFLQKYCLPSDSQTLPKILDVKLAQFLGYFEGDGSFEKERIDFSESTKQLTDVYSKLAKEIFNANTSTKHRTKKGYFQTRIYGKQIVNFINENFPEINTALESRIPKAILSSNNIILASFLKGFYDAEGYASNKEIGLGINNKRLAQQIQFCLLRFGIISSLLEYDNNKNTYSNNPRYTVIISGKHSIEIFKKNINFDSINKSQKLDEILSKKSCKDKSRQILANGQQIKEFLLENNSLKQFYSANTYLNGKRKISKEIFKKQIIDKANKESQIELQKHYDYGLLPTEILSINKSEKQPMIDISVENQNFIANGLIVHNSSQRFERLREEAMQDFFKRCAEKFDTYFIDKIPNLKGVIIGGPGMTKQYFIDKGAIHHELIKKIIGVIDTSYTDEGGIREIVQKSEDLLKDTQLMQESLTLDSFLGEIAKDGLATYGSKEVEEMLDSGRVGKLIISEDIPWLVVKKKCQHCEYEEIEIFRDPKDYNESKLVCSKCNSKVEVLEEIDYLEYMIEKANQTGAKIQVVSTETGQGQQFLNGFGGVGAILRY
jgi:peptide subunit release factor 1 (eRF1)/intein/homing endonuclease/DNA-binding Xre family transcriptional regulator